MPLKPGKSKKVIQQNIKELVSSKPSPARKKAIATSAKKRGISKKQAVAISYSKAKKSRKKY